MYAIIHCNTYTHIPYVDFYTLSQLEMDSNFVGIVSIVRDMMLKDPKYFKINQKVYLFIRIL